MSVYLAEFVGTALLILLGNGVVANVLLDRTKGHGGGWIVITAGWGLGVFVAVLCVADLSGAHINPAVTVGLCAAGAFDWALAPGYVLAQVLGAILGAGLVYLVYRDHYSATADADLKMATFCTAPNIRNLPINLFCEFVGTFVLVLAVLRIGAAGEDAVGKLGALDALPVGLVVFGIGLSLGGTTGYAINPARDLGPRLAHACLPIPGKRDSDWSYSWVPIVGPLTGGALAAAANAALF